MSDMLTCCAISRYNAQLALFHIEQVEQLQASHAISKTRYTNRPAHASIFQGGFRSEP
jgi:hypothetical protein